MNHNSPSIDVIVRTANRPLAFVVRAFASIKAQTFSPASVVVVVTGAEPEGWAAFLAGAPLGNIPLRQTVLPPAGPAGNRGQALNVGVGLCTADWISFLDDDDTWHPGFLRLAAEALKEGRGCPQFGGVVARTEEVHERLVGGAWVEKGRRPFNPDLVVVDLAALAVRNRFTINALVVSSGVFKVVGGYREDLSVLEDWEFNVRAASRFQFEVIPQVLVRYHLRKSAGGIANTALSEHVRVATRIKNEWIRADMAAGRLGPGQLALAGEARGLGGWLGALVRLRSKLRRVFRAGQG